MASMAATAKCPLETLIKCRLLVKGPGCRARCPLRNRSTSQICRMLFVSGSWVKGLRVSERQSQNWPTLSSRCLSKTSQHCCPLPTCWGKPPKFNEFCRLARISWKEPEKSFQWPYLTLKSSRKVYALTLKNAICLREWKNLRFCLTTSTQVRQDWWAFKITFTSLRHRWPETSQGSCDGDIFSLFYYYWAVQICIDLYIPGVKIFLS